MTDHPRSLTAEEARKQSCASGFVRKDEVRDGLPLTGDWDCCATCGFAAYEHRTLSDVEVERLSRGADDLLQQHDALPCTCTRGPIRRDLHADHCPNRIAIMVSRLGWPSLAESHRFLREENATLRRHGQDLLRWVREHETLWRNRLEDPRGNIDKGYQDYCAAKLGMLSDVLAEAARLGLGGEGTG